MFDEPQESLANIGVEGFAHNPRAHFLRLSHGPEAQAAESAIIDTAIRRVFFSGPDADHPFLAEAAGFQEPTYTAPGCAGRILSAPPFHGDVKLIVGNRNDVTFHRFNALTEDIRSIPPGTAV